MIRVGVFLHSKTFPIINPFNPPLIDSISSMLSTSSPIEVNISAKLQGFLKFNVIFSQL